MYCRGDDKFLANKERERKELFLNSNNREIAVIASDIRGLAQKEGKFNERMGIWWLNVSRSRKNYTVENYFSNETRLHSFRRYDKYPTLYIFIFARVIDVNERLIYISYLKRRENFHPRFSRRIIPLVVLPAPDYDAYRRERGVRFLDEKLQANICRRLK